MASAEQLRMTHSIEGQVQEVHGNVQDVGDKVRDVDDKLDLANSSLFFQTLIVISWAQRAS
jgi:hypothetical protein